MEDNSELAGRVRARVGTMLAGKYRIDGVLGVGGMAVVYAATHRNQAEFAIKVLHPELSYREDVRSRFLREGYTANSVKHPGAVRVVDDDVAEDGAAFLVMELLHGAVVESLWETHGSRLAVHVAAGIVDQLLDVLSAAHAKGIVHRDIKPANLFLTTDGTLKVLDFGIARAREALNGGLSAGKSTGTGMLLGTPAFMAPEQALAKTNEIDAQTDLWAAAATFFTLVSGQLVHEGDNLPQLLIHAATEHARSLGEVAPEVPAPLVQVVDRGLAFQKSERWPSAEAMRQALDEAYKAAYGAALSTARAELEALVQSSVESTVHIDPAPMPLPARPSVRPTTAVATHALRYPFPSRTTPPPASTALPHEDTPQWRSPLPRVALGVTAGLILAVAVGIGARNLLARTASTSAPAPPVAPLPPSPAQTVALSPPPTEVRTATATAVAETVPPRNEAPDASPPPLAAAAPRYKRPTYGGAAAQPVRVRPAANCNPPFTIDADGHRVPKPECL